MDTGTDISPIAVAQTDVWSLECDITAEDMGVVIQEVKTDDIILSGSVAAEEFSVDLDYDRINIMNLDVNVSFNGISSTISESQVVPFSKILEMTEFSPEYSNEKGYAASAYSAKRISDSVFTIEEKNKILNEKIDNATGIANTANASVSALGVRVDSVGKSIKEINDKLDGVVESFFYDYVPSRENMPASQWISEGTEAEHVGDTFTNTSLYGDGAGQSWRWLENDGSYDWHLIADTDATKALALAAEAKAAADGKTKTFLVTPYNYQAGDIWIVGDVVPDGFPYEKGSILYAIADGEEYYSSNWLIYAEYTSKSFIENTIASLNQAIEAAESSAKNYTDEGKAAIQESIDGLVATKANIIDIYDRATTDGKISKSELDAIEAAQAYADAQNQLLQVTLSAYADGVASEAEKIAIEYAKSKVDEAKEQLQQYTDTKLGEYKATVDATTKELDDAISDAEEAAKNYTDGVKEVLQKSIQELYDAKANITDVYEKSAADSLITGAEERAIKAAQDAATAAKKAAEAAANAYADGVVQEAEQNAINEANKNLEATKAKLEEAIAEIEEIANSVDAANQILDTKITDIETGVTESVKEINERLDGVVENYFEEGDPTDPDNENNPAREWTDAQKKEHLGDTYTNISSYENDPDNAGKSWRWTYTDSEHTGYHWHPIADSDAVKALLEASKAKTAADRKSKTFITQPVPPYAEGDLWVQGDSGDIMRCINPKESGSFDEDDWEIASKYTDDTKANEAMEEAERAKKAAEAAKAVTDAFDNDSVFTVSEKRSIRKALKDINPSENSYTIPIAWSVKNRATLKGSDWELITDKSDENYGWYVSNEHSSDGRTIVKIEFDVHIESNIEVRIMSRAESNYDYTLLSNLDTTILETDTYTDTERVADTTRERQGQIVVHNYIAVPVGHHFVTVMYRKDKNTNTPPDNGYYQISEIKAAQGSLGDWISFIYSKGLDISLCDPAIYAADELFSFLDNYGNIWGNVNDDISGAFRVEVYKLFTAYYKEISTIMVNTATSDLRYLGEAIKNGHTYSDNGLVMTSLLAVGDTEDLQAAYVEAFMNGSDFAKHTEHGKLMHALGIPAETADGDDDLEARSREAKTRMYENGAVFASMLHLLNGCKIGKSIRIEDDKIVIDLANNNMSMSLFEGGLVAEGYYTATIGGCGGAAVQGFAHGMDAFCPANTNPIGVQGEAKDGDYAFYSSTGLFAGLRPKTRVITTPKTQSSPNVLTNIDFSVLVNATSGTYHVLLPTTPLDGQEYVIESRGADIIIYSSIDVWIHNNGTTVGSRTFHGVNSIRFKYYKEANIWTCTWLDWKQG